jgi:hypothetical protein
MKYSLVLRRIIQLYKRSMMTITEYHGHPVMKNSKVHFWKAWNAPFTVSFLLAFPVFPSLADSFHIP